MPEESTDKNVIDLRQMLKEAQERSQNSTCRLAGAESCNHSGSCAEFILAEIYRCVQKINNHFSRNTDEAPLSGE